MSEGKTDGHCDKGNRNRMPCKSLIGTIGIHSKGCETLGGKMEGADLFRLVSVHRLK